ncbi:MAG: AMP-binding protein [Sphingobium sp.]
MDWIHQGVFQPHMIADGLKTHANRPIIHLPDGTSQTGAQVADEISRFIQALPAAGASAGSRLAILSGNRAEVLHLGHATMFIDVLYVPLHPLGSVDDYLYVVEDAGIDTIVFDPKFEDRIAALKERAPQVKTFLSFGPSTIGTDISALAAAQTPAPLVPPALTGDEVFRLAYSGGTTGKPKAIQANHRTAHAMTVIQMAEWEWPAEIRQLLCAPLSHSGASLFLPTLMRGGAVYIQPGFDPVEVMKAIETHRINCLLLVPTMIYAILDHPRFDEFDLSSLETIFYGASAMSTARLKEGIAKIGPVFFQFYGQSEAPMTVTVLRRGEHDVTDDKRLASCGRPVPWVHVALLDHNGNEVPDGEPGEICVRGPLVMPGYLNKPEQTAEAFAHDWLHTGDVAVRDPGGFLRIVDRSKDMIITGGFNVFPREVEDALSSHPAVATSGVFGTPDDHWGELVTAAVVLRPGMSCTPEELTLHVRQLKGVHQSPKRIEFIEAIPLTAVGKPDKKALRARFNPSVPAT